MDKIRVHFRRRPLSATRAQAGAVLARSFEIGVWVTVWWLAFELMMQAHEWMIRYESFTTGTPVATIVAQQDASSGMRAFGEGLEVLYLTVLIYLL